jgi:hypothetical protein
MKFYSKALTLKKLKCKNASIPKFIVIRTQDFFNKKEIILKRIVRTFSKNNFLIVRSSSSDEDTSSKSNAGKFESVAMVKKKENNIDIEI